MRTVCTHSTRSGSGAPRKRSECSTRPRDGSARQEIHVGTLELGALDPLRAKRYLPGKSFMMEWFSLSNEGSPSRRPTPDRRRLSAYSPRDNAA